MGERQIPDEILLSATDMMRGDEDAALRWLHTPLETLNNLSPSEYVERYEGGALEVLDLIGRIRNGVYS